jgi:hypothetical protein
MKWSKPLARQCEVETLATVIFFRSHSVRVCFFWPHGLDHAVRRALRVCFFWPYEGQTLFHLRVCFFWQHGDSAVARSRMCLFWPCGASPWMWSNCRKILLRVIWGHRWVGGNPGGIVYLGSFPTIVTSKNFDGFLYLILVLILGRSPKKRLLVASWCHWGEKVKKFGYNSLCQRAFCR